MKVLVTGGAGYIGCVLISHLLKEGYEVTAFDTCLFGAEPLLAFTAQKFCLLRGDIRDEKALQHAMQDIDVVVHLAAIVGEHAFIISEKAAKEINVEGTKKTLSAAKKCGIQRFIFISTCSNYGISLPDILTKEDAPLNPLTNYAISKVKGEELALEMDAIVLRFGTICGLSPRMRFDLLVNECGRSAALGIPIQIFAPNAWRPFLHIKDAARAIEYCLKVKDELLKDKVFNVISENYKKGDLAKLVSSHFSQDVEIMDTSPDSRDYRVSAKRFEERLGFIPEYTVERALLEVAKAVKGKIFSNPLWFGHSGVPKNAECLLFGES